MISATHNLSRALVEEFPEELLFWKKKFIWASSRKGFNFRTSYQDHWRPRKRQGIHLIPLFSDLVDDIAEAHLDFERFARNHDPKSLVRPAAEQLGFWAGTWAGDYTYSTAIDIDAHRRVGNAWLPARYHVDKWPDEETRPGYSTWASPYSSRWVPLTWIGLDYFKTARLIYDNFPERLWAFSSASLGLGVWQTFPKARKPDEASQEVREAIERIGLRLEVYPSPPRSYLSLGRQHRRPCGMDSGVITNDGVVTDPIAQIRLFMQSTTPSFKSLVRALIERSRYYHSYSHDPDLWIEQANEFERVIAWMNDGCPDCETVIASGPPLLSRSSSSALPIDEAEGQLIIEQDGCSDPVPLCFRTCDLKEINERHLWVEFVLYLAENGLPCEDSFVAVISTLAKWLWFYELYDLDPDDRFERIVELLSTYIENKHNGFVTRLNNGDMDVFNHIGRIVRHYTRNINDRGESTFVQMRYRRDSKQYKHGYTIAAMIDLSTHSSSLTSIRSISCDLLTKVANEDEEQGQWVYVPDDSPLPEELMRKVSCGLKNNGINIRKSGDGEYATMKAITRLINYLKVGGAGGKRISQKLLEQMGFKNRTRETIKKALYRIPVIHDRGYRSKSASRRYVLDDSVLEAFESL
jgi:hypothetical protein